jgi:hypothetical protein
MPGLIGRDGADCRQAELPPAPQPLDGPRRVLGQRDPPIELGYVATGTSTDACHRAAPFHLRRDRAGPSLRFAGARRAQPLGTGGQPSVGLTVPLHPQNRTTSSAASRRSPNSRAAARPGRRSPARSQSASARPARPACTAPSTAAVRPPNAARSSIILGDQTLVAAHRPASPCPPAPAAAGTPETLT